MSERSDLDARYNQHLINGYTSQQAWDMATSELGTKSSHFTIGSDGRVETTSLYDTEQAKIKAKQEEYDAWLESGSTNATNDANAKTTTSTSATSNIQDNSTATGGGYTDTKTIYVSEDTPESLAYKAKAATVSEQEDAVKAKLRAEGVYGRSLLSHPDVKALTNERNALELAEERSQEHTTTQLTTYYDVNGVEITESEYTVSHTANAETGAVENVQVGNPIKPVPLTQADADKLNAESEFAPRTLTDLQDEANDDAILATFPIDPDTGIQFPSQEALDEYKANNPTSDLKTESDTYASDGSTQSNANQALSDAADAQQEADELLESGDMEAYNLAQLKANTALSKAQELQDDADSEADDNDTLMFQAEFDEENLDDEYESRPEPSVSELRGAQDKGDWRVRLRLAPQSDYLYNAQDPGILAPLAETDGIIFPYMPRIDTVHQARYSNYDLPHSNYRGYFYGGSHQERVIVSATFTAQDTKEANYMLAALHFLRSCTKMFYGQDAQRGTPPPLVFLSGLGDHQFNEHPCAVEIVNINLPNDVDYIEAGDVDAQSGDFMSPLSAPKTSSAPSFTGALSRLFGSGMSFGGTPAPTYRSENIYKAESKGTTRMPTKMEIAFNLLPIQTRDQVSNEFSLEDYASGSLLKKGFW
jgi:hypothetical protein